MTLHTLIAWFADLGILSGIALIYMGFNSQRSKFFIAGYFIFIISFRFIDKTSIYQAYRNGQMFADHFFK